MTRMPLVCMSIVASAFQYGWAPTLMPVTTTLISPPSWVNSMIPRSTRETQSMVSVPESIAIFAPAEMANHSTGACNRRARSMAARTRRHSGSAIAPSALVGSPSSTTRRMPSGDPSAAAGPDHLLRVGIHLAQRVRRRVGDVQRQPGARRAGQPQHQLPRFGVLVTGIGYPQLHQHLLQAQRLGTRGE